ncbi:uncharacterized protein LOC130729975 [Lotus japonicus]|uniref:uncharacterized protein LOC130729975 n=1 Tax=Lotus japonicus TaxID=34305 RepID=UPI0025832965|nr:uncharacterized protein LOC130729975 [Lotus japonicus]
MEGENGRKLKILCLHGFRTSGSFLKKQISKWDPSIFSQFDLEFPDGKFPAGGKSDIEGIFPPPYFEWFQFNKEFTEYTNLDECISYLCEYITANGPFDGFLGFSQGATLSALLIGYQAQGKLLKEHPPIKFFVSISGSKFRDPTICNVAYKDPIKAKSVHFIGEKDWLKLPSEELASAFHKSLLIRHPQGHTVPRLDEVSTGQLRDWVAGILGEPKDGEPKDGEPKDGVPIGEHETRHEEKKSEEKGSKVEVNSTNGDKEVNGVEINKGGAETVEVAQA